MTTDVYLAVKEKSAQNKSMLASKNLPSPITKAADGHHWIRVLAAELALRLNDARKTTPTLWPKTIVLHARKGRRNIVIETLYLLIPCRIRNGSLETSTVSICSRRYSGCYSLCRRPAMERASRRFQDDESDKCPISVHWS